MKDGILDPMRGKCPLAGCRLLFLGGTRALAPAAVVSYHYCPPCTASFLVVDESPSGGGTLVLRGRADARDFTQHPPDPYRHLRLSDRDLAVHRDELAAAVLRFRTSLTSGKQLRCAQSHVPADRMSQWGIMMERSLYLSGCDTCLIACVQERDRCYGWELGVTFAYDVARSDWVLREVHRPSMDPGVLATCLALLNRLRSGYDTLSRTFENRRWGLV